MPGYAQHCCGQPFARREAADYDVCGLVSPSKYGTSHAVTAHRFGGEEAYRCITDGANLTTVIGGAECLGRVGGQPTIIFSDTGFDYIFSDTGFDYIVVAGMAEQVDADRAARR